MFVLSVLSLLSYAMVNYTLAMAVVTDELGITNLDNQDEPNIIRTKRIESTPKLVTKHNNLQEISGPSVQVYPNMLSFPDGVGKWIPPP